MIVGGAVLGCGGCAGFLYGFMGREWLMLLGAVGFVAGVVAAISGLIGLIIAFVRAIRKAPPASSE